VRDQTRSTRARILVGLCLLVLVAGSVGFSQTTRRGHDPDLPVSEFHIARMVVGGGGLFNSRGFGVPYWAIDYPMAEVTFLPALGRLTTLQVGSSTTRFSGCNNPLRPTGTPPSVRPRPCGSIWPVAGSC
jgi:hypothetical protein